MKPRYTKGEEIFNMVTHIVGGAVGVTALVLCVVFAALHGNVYGVVGGSLYGASMVVLYTMSSVYHGLSPKLGAKKVFRVLDHCTIFFLIAGTYTPIALCSIREYNTALGWTIFGIIWGMAALGITLTAIDLKKYAKFSMVCYLGMGWCIIFTAPILPKMLEKGALVFLILGGVAYTIGAILYGIGKKKKYIHSIFHLFVVAGSILHFFCILFYVI
ncbi:MAG: hemolysin III family protein [Lachnospiraceae bacterium]|nr:hemolysin III family protein [Lachnospiraceae bacterium]